ncbi:MAG: phosphate ABC transporter permease subunit PstC [Chloroflexi bacterium AL-W]|nr:phosphate ABC transporter permease subunit PstC [Chloroflexi bacterium AL-N1]NOK67508.1 phosphate ABC transporter permease subunit PstC [Chloroflexi bacterium AL-N10]NOK75000.1 phosphate ABC transporter permease subunit PstC [Chloroflexi bacterium AL-N5]NOK81787.1 phosphate ABC transporter permease subunit PstC [Chloroflexi bacterium AL-W]NOK89633.1 phosphate ABC transporter permease subunit PstC [Chloroflexi bacterium AL-N15]
MEEQISTSAQSRPVASATAAPLDLRKQPRLGEAAIQGLLFICGIVSIFTTLGIVYVLGQESLLFFGLDEITITEFLTSTEWRPETGSYGVLPLVNATLVVSVIAMVIAIPIGLGSALYLSEYASPRVRGILKPVLEILAGVPTVVYGYFAITFMTPLLMSIFGRETVSFQNTASAGIVVGILIIPLIASLSEDALSAVPQSLRQAAYGLGSTRFETATKIVFPAALSGVISACIIGISRAIGETMIVALAAGSGPAFTYDPFQAAETMTGYIARISGGDISYNTPDYNSIFAIGLLLFLITLTLNIISRFVVRRFREVYE